MQTEKTFRYSFKSSHAFSMQRDLKILQPPQNILQNAREAKLKIQKHCQIYFAKNYGYWRCRTSTSKWQWATTPGRRAHYRLWKQEISNGARTTRLKAGIDGPSNRQPTPKQPALSRGADKVGKILANPFRFTLSADFYLRKNCPALILAHDEKSRRNRSNQKNENPN